jgi:hypothetical protein
VQYCNFCAFNYNKFVHLVGELTVLILPLDTQLSYPSCKIGNNVPHYISPVTFSRLADLVRSHTTRFKAIGSLPTNTVLYCVKFKHYLQTESFSGKNVSIAQNPLVQGILLHFDMRATKKRAFLFTFLKIWPPYYTVLNPTIICVTRKYSKVQEICSNVLEAEFKEKICDLK